MHGRGGKGEKAPFFFTRTRYRVLKDDHTTKPLNVKPRTRCRTLKSNHTAKFFERSDIWLNTFQGRTNHQTLSKAKHATKSIHRPLALSKSLSERAPRHDQIFFRTNARPNYVFLQPSTQDQLFCYLFIYLFCLFFFLRANTSSGRAHDKKKFSVRKLTRPKIHKNQNISQVQFTTKHFFRSIAQIKIY